MRGKCILSVTGKSGQSAMRCKYLFHVSILSILAGTLSQASPPATDPLLPDWQEVVLQHKGLLGSATTRIGLKSFDGDLPPPLPGHSPEGGTADRDKLIQLEVHSAIDPVAGSHLEMTSSLWFAPGERLPVRLLRSSRGKDAYDKYYRFDPQGVLRVRIKPSEDAEERQADGGGRSEDSFYPFPQWATGCSRIFESSQIIYHLISAVRNDLPLPDELCVFDRKKVYRLLVENHGTEQVGIPQKTDRDSAGKHSTSSVDTLHLSLYSRAEKSGAKGGKPFTLLGIKEKLHLWLSLTRGIPMRVEGRLKGSATTRLELIDIIE